MIKKSNMKKIMKQNGSIEMPLFIKTEEGWQQSLETVTVTSIAEMEEYLKTYAEIKDYIKTYFSSTIGQLYTNSLEAMIDPKNGFSKFLERFDNDRPLTISQRQARAINDSDVDLTVYNNLETILWAINTHQNAKQYKPATEVIDLLNSKSKGIDYIIPRITSNGTIDIKPTKNSLSVLTVGLSEEEGSKLKEMLLNDEFFKDKADLVEKFFHSAGFLAAANKQLSGVLAVKTMVQYFGDLLYYSSRLFDIDLGKILKGAPRGIQTGNGGIEAPIESQEMPVLSMSQEVAPTNTVVMVIPCSDFGNALKTGGNYISVIMNDARLSQKEDGVIEVRKNSDMSVVQTFDEQLEK